MEGPPGSAPGLTGPRPVVQLLHFGPVNIGPPRRSRTFIVRLSVESTTVVLQAEVKLLGRGRKLDDEPDGRDDEPPVEGSGPGGPGRDHNGRRSQRREDLHHEWDRSVVPDRRVDLVLRRDGAARERRGQDHCNGLQHPTAV